MSSNKLSLNRSTFLNDFGVFPRGEATGNVKGKILQIVHFPNICCKHSGTGGLPILLFHPYSLSLHPSFSTDLFTSMQTLLHPLTHPSLFSLSSPFLKLDLKRYWSCALWSLFFPGSYFSFPSQPNLMCDNLLKVFSFRTIQYLKSLNIRPHNSLADLNYWLDFPDTFKIKL